MEIMYTLNTIWGYSEDSPCQTSASGQRRLGSMASEGESAAFVRGHTPSKIQGAPPGRHLDPLVLPVQLEAK